MHINTTGNQAKWAKHELLAQLDYALELAKELNRQIETMDASLEEIHQLPKAA